MELKGDDNVVALMVQTFETRTVSNVYMYPGTFERGHASPVVERYTEEEDVTRRLLDTHKVVVPPLRYYCTTHECGECAGCKAALSG